MRKKTAFFLGRFLEHFRELQNMKPCCNASGKSARCRQASINNCMRPKRCKINCCCARPLKRLLAKSSNWLASAGAWASTKRAAA